MRLGLVTEAFVDRPLPDLMEWLRGAAPGLTDLEVGAGAYAPPGHCDTPVLLRDRERRVAYLDDARSRGFRIAALNVWGNPLHPDRAVAEEHDRALRDAIRLGALMRVDRIVAMAGCPAGSRGDRTPDFAAGGWLPYLEGVSDVQWETWVEPYWRDVSEFARVEHPELLICLELHPGTAVYNVETFERLAALGPNLAANLDPSHFFWMRMDGHAVARHLHDRVGHVHAKDLSFIEENVGLNGILDRRWPGDPHAMPWNFATVGRGHDAEWWAELMRALRGSPVETVAIEHEDPLVPAISGVPEASELLSPLLDSA
jgi:sugar phosphate isomerase/epimerase